MGQLNNMSRIGINLRAWDEAQAVWTNRFVNSLQEGVSRYPIYREVRVAARVDLQDLVDAIALDTAWRAERMNSGNLVLDGDGIYVAAYGSRKAEYCSCIFYIWAADVTRAEETKARILAHAGPTLITEPMFSIDWHFLTSKGELEDASIEEMATDVLHDEAYPDLEGGVRKFIARYLDAPETVLVLQGPPGTGKTRLIRGILGEMTRRKGESARALYTGDVKTLQSDEIFVKFITGSHDAFVIEDADHVLKPRADGNEHLHRFLTIADGVVRSQGRKIVFSTNLPNVGDLDDALVRPGRCFARQYVRTLTQSEAEALAVAIVAGDGEKAARISSAFGGKQRGHSLAEVYQALR
jgi:hypothetical protein